MVFDESFFLGQLLLLLLLLVLGLLLLLLAVVCLVNVESAGKLPLCSELSTRVPARINAVKVVMGWMLSRAPVDGCAPPITILRDSSSEGASQTCEARARQRPTYSPNGLPGFYFVMTRSAHSGLGQG